MFVDGDDTLPDNSLSELTRELAKADYDIVVGGYELLNETGGVVGKYLPEEAIFSAEQFAISLISGKIMGSPCMRLFKRKLFNDEVFSTPRNVIRGEDLLMNIIISSNVKTVRTISKPVYYYHRRKSSTMGTFVSTLDYEMDFRARVKDRFEYCGYSIDDNKEALDLADLNSYVYCIYYNIRNGSVDDATSLIKYIESQSRLFKLKRNLNRKNRLFLKLVSISIIRDVFTYINKIK